jgi:large subunit ribosomal protein L22
MKVQASIKNYRRSASKVREIVPVVKGLNVEEADLQLRYLKKGSARDLLGLLASAVANAKNNFNLEERNLFVANLVINEGRVMKRWRARAYGRAAKILKRSCHVIITLEERKEEKKDSDKPEKKKGKVGRAKEKQATSSSKTQGDKGGKDKGINKDSNKSSKTAKKTEGKKGAENKSQESKDKKGDEKGKETKESKGR